MRVDRPKNITRQDLIALSQIELCGFIRTGLDDGRGYLENNRDIAPGRLQRLAQMGFVAPSGDSMFGVRSQTWRLTNGTKTNKIQCGAIERPEDT